MSRCRRSTRSCASRPSSSSWTCSTRSGITFIVVTHDQDEAMALATRIAVMDRGQVVQVGTPAEIYEFPRSRFVADFVGTHQPVRGHGERLRPRPDHACAAPRSAASCWSMTPGSFSARPARLGGAAAREDAARQATGERGAHQSAARHGLGARLSRQSLDLSDQDHERQAGDGLCAERAPHLGAAIDWSDEVFVSWSADAAVVLQT